MIDGHTGYLGGTGIGPIVPDLCFLLGGAIVTESVFGLDGMGYYFIQKLGQLDIYAVMAWLLLDEVPPAHRAAADWARDAGQTIRTNGALMRFSICRITN